MTVPTATTLAVTCPPGWKGDPGGDGCVPGDWAPGDQPPTCPDGWVTDPDGDGCVPAPASSGETEPLGGDPNPGTKPDKRLKKNKAEGDVTTFAGVATDTSWRGVLVVEGTPTGDGREFATDSLSWADPPLPLQWQKESGHGSDHDVTVRVGSITRVWRDGANIMGEGNFDLGGPPDDDAHEAHRRMGAEQCNGVSINADDITDADIEYVFPESEGEEEDDELDIISILFGSPEKIIFHAARIRAATLCDIPAFVEATLHLTDDNDGAALAASAVVVLHSTPTSDESWDGAINERRLPARLDVAVAREAYGYIDDRAVTSANTVLRDECRFIHHEVDADGHVGAANLTACSAAVGVLNSHSTSVPDSQRRGVYEHMVQHLRDAGREAPPLEPKETTQESLVAHAWHDVWRPPREWFADPNLQQPTPIIVTDAGRVFGLATEWGECHLGYQNECILPPREGHHSYYLTGEMVCDDGSHIPVGQITAGIPHAPLSFSASRAAEHYENTEAVVADITVGDGKYGIWVAGAIRPTANAARVQALRASGQVSPDWRRIGGQMRLVGLLTVNVSGFQVPKVRTYAKGGEIRSMVASGLVSVHQQGQETEEQSNQRALRLLRDELARRVHQGV